MKKTQPMLPLGIVGKDQYNNFLMECLCPCGQKVIIRNSHFQRAEITSCGCHSHRNQRVALANTKHGISFKPTYESWVSMRQRCINPHHIHYKNYGGRGIGVCDRWLQSFLYFLQDMGVRPDDSTLERKNNDLGYEPDNCVWATPKEQGRNRRNNHLLTVGDETLCISAWSEITGIKKSTIRQRIIRGWTPAEAVGRCS